MREWTIHEWPHSRSLGEKWVAQPPITPPDEKWPGIRFFDSKAEAEAFVAGRRFHGAEGIEKQP